MLFDLIGGALGLAADCVDTVCGDGTTAIVATTAAAVVLSPLIAAEEAEKTRKAVEKAAIFNRPLSARAMVFAQYIDKTVRFRVFHSENWFERTGKIINVEIYDNSYSADHGKEVVVYEMLSRENGKIIKLHHPADKFQIIKD